MVELLSFDKYCTSQWSGMNNNLIVIMLNLPDELHSSMLDYADKFLENI